MSDCVVITPTRGDSPWLEETVASVAACAPGWRHVLVAPDARVTELSRRFPAVRVVPERGEGMYAAINTGLVAAGAWEAFTYLNDDDVLLAGFAAAAREAELAVGKERIVYGGVKLIDGRGRRLGAIPVSPAPALNRALYAQRIEPVYQHGTVITRAVVERCGGFDEGLRFCGDSEFFARACVGGVRFVGVGRTVAAFRLRAGQLTKNRAAMRDERWRVDEKLRLLAPERKRVLAWARWRFRLANLPVYAERIARHGWITFDELLERGGQA